VTRDVALCELRSPGVALVATSDFLDAARELADAEVADWLALLGDDGGAPGAGGLAQRSTPIPRSVARSGGRARAQLVLRRFRPGGLLARLRPSSLASPERPLAELRAHAALWQRGAPVAEPAFAVARRSAAGRRWHFVVASVRIDDAEPALAAIARASTAQQLAALARAAGAAIRAFHDAGGRHADLHVGNLVAACAGERAWIVDLDRARADLRPTPRRRACELARLYRSLAKRGLLDPIDDDARRAFWDAYVAGDRALESALARAWRCQRPGRALRALARARRA